MPGAEPEAALQLVQHAAAAGVDAEVLQRQLEVRHVGLHLDGGAAEQRGAQEPELLRQREHERAQRRDVAPQRVPGHGHEVLGERDADVALAVLLLRHARVAVVAGGAAPVRPHRVHQTVLGAAAVGPAVGEQHGGAAHPEQRVGHQHRAVVAQVGVQRDVLRAHHQRVRVRVHLKGNNDDIVIILSAQSPMQGRTEHTGARPATPRAYPN